VVLKHEPVGRRVHATTSLGNLAIAETERCQAAACTAPDDDLSCLESGDWQSSATTIGSTSFGRLDMGSPTQRPADWHHSGRTVCPTVAHVQSHLVFLQREPTFESLRQHETSPYRRCGAAIAHWVLRLLFGCCRMLCKLLRRLATTSESTNSPCLCRTSLRPWFACLPSKEPDGAA
jgi:hypothetical protein